MTANSSDLVHQRVARHYEKAVEEQGCCDTNDGCGCGGGYSEDDMRGVPNGADLGFGCGNPLVFAGLREGETVLDLGSGAGVDCFIAARKVGPTGKVIGVDMIQAMIERAERHAHLGGFSNVQFRQGIIENLPVDSGSVDVVISNCVINLSPDKEKVFEEMHRVLVPGGRVTVADIVALTPIPVTLRDDDDLYSGCVSGAAMIEEVENMMKRAGFANVRVDVAESSKQRLRIEEDVEIVVASALIAGTKPGE